MKNTVSRTVAPSAAAMTSLPPTASRPAPTTATEPAPRPRRAIERHLDKFFDRNGDRRITLGETYTGLHDLGIGRAAAAATALAINVGLGLPTGGGLTTVNLDNIQRGKHPGDSGVLDTNSEFVPEKFDAIFDKHAKTYGDALTSDEVAQFRKANYFADPNANPVNFVAGLGEFQLLFHLGAEDRGGTSVLTKARLNDFYNGDLFEKIAAENKAKRDARSGTITGAIRNAFNEWIF